jgi:hypothetical protein
MFIALPVCAEAGQALKCSVDSIDSESSKAGEVTSTHNKYEFIIEFTSPENTIRYDNSRELGDFRVETTRGMYTMTSHSETTNIYGGLVKNTLTLRISRLTGKINGTEDGSRNDVRFFSNEWGMCLPTEVKPKL